MNDECKICDGPRNNGPLPGPNVCGYCMHIVLERSFWTDDINSLLTEIYETRASIDRLKFHLAQHEIITSELAELIWNWHCRTIGPFDLEFLFLRSLKSSPIEKSIDYILENCQAFEFNSLLGLNSGELEISRFLDDNNRSLRHSTGYAHHGEAAYCLREFRFGSDYVADFVIITPRRSIAPVISLVELEPVDDIIFTKKQLPSNRLVTALNQIKQWRSWIRSNPRQFRDELDKRTKRTLDPAELDRWIRRDEIEYDQFIFIGRRKSIENGDYRNLWTSNQDRITIHTYDSILEVIISQDIDAIKYDSDLKIRDYVRNQRAFGYSPKKSLEELLPKAKASPNKANSADAKSRAAD